MKADVVGNDCGLSVRLMGVCEEECHFAFICVEDHFLEVAPFGDGCDRTLQLLLCDLFVVVTTNEGDVICEEGHLHRLRHNGARIAPTLVPFCWTTPNPH